MTTVVLNSAAASATIDTTGFCWMSIQVGVGMAGQTQLNAQFSNDGTNWFNGAFSPSSSTSTGISTSLGITANLFHGPIAGRFLRFLPTGFTSGTQTILVYMQALPGVMPSVGMNAGGSISITAGGGVVGIGNADVALGTATQQFFQIRATGAAAVAAATQLLASVASLDIHITEIYWTLQGGTSPTNDLLLRLSAASSQSPAAPNAGGQEMIMKCGSSGERVFRTPWKIATVNAVALNYEIAGTLSSQTWFLNVHGYYA
jgi:hypothetical protein